MAIDTISTGLPSNHHLSFDAVKYRTTDTEVVTGTSYEYGEAVKCNTANTTMMDTGLLEAGYLSGYYSVRINCKGSGLNPFDLIGELEVYKDGVKQDYTDTGDGNDSGEIVCPYLGLTSGGTRVLLWFDPKSTYQLKFKTKGQTTISSPTVLDYIKFDQVHHFNPLMNWINASETTGGDLWMIDTNIGAVTGDGDTITIQSITTAHPFKKIYYANAMIMEDVPATNVRLHSSTTDTQVVFVFNQAGAWSSTIPYRWFVVGTVELPVVRYL